MVKSRGEEQERKSRGGKQESKSKGKGKGGPSNNIILSRAQARLSAGLIIRIRGYNIKCILHVEKDDREGMIEDDGGSEDSREHECCSEQSVEMRDEELKSRQSNSDHFLSEDPGL